MIVGNAVGAIALADDGATVECAVGLRVGATEECTEGGAVRKAVGIDEGIGEGENVCTGEVNGGCDGDNVGLRG